MNVPKVDIKQLLEAGVHLGHKTLRWNPKMKKYIFGEKNSIHIIDLTQTVDFLKNALVEVHKVISSGGKLLIVSTKKQASEQVSDLAKETGASIVFGPKAEASFDFYQAYDGETFKVGGIQIKALHTPGHTLESTCYLLLDEQKKEYCIFTGDTLFIGDVGRPDLAVKSDLSQADLAKLLHQSLKEKKNV